MRFTNAVALTGLTLFAADAVAHSDVLLRADGGQVVIGAAEDLEGEAGGPSFSLGDNVFEGVLLNPAMPTPPFGYDFERTEPGFYSAPGISVGDDLPGNADVAMSLTSFSVGGASDVTFYWDGVGAVNFQPLSVVQPSADFTFAPMGPSPFTTSDPTGLVHDHPLFGLTGGAAEGVYLISPKVSVAGLTDSDPFLMVFLASSVLVNDDMAEELEGALELYEEGGPEPIVGGVNFAFFVEAVDFARALPEPSTAVLAVLGAALCGVARRR